MLNFVGNIGVWMRTLALSCTACHCQGLKKVSLVQKLEFSMRIDAQNINYDKSKHQKQMGSRRKPTETSKNVSKMYLQLYLIKKVNFDAGTLNIMMSEVHHG